MTRYNFSAKSEKVANKASKRSRTNTPTHEDSKNSELRNDLVSMLKPIDDDDDEDQVYNFFISLNFKAIIFFSRKTLSRLSVNQM